MRSVDLTNVASLITLMREHRVLAIKVGDVEVRMAPDAFVRPAPVAVPETPAHPAQPANPRATGRSRLGDMDPELLFASSGG